MVLIAFDIYIKHERSSPDSQFYRLTQLLSDFGLEMDFLGGLPVQRWDISQFLAFILPRIPTAFGPKFRLIRSHYTEFAVRCAKLVPEKVW